MWARNDSGSGLVMLRLPAGNCESFAMVVAAVDMEVAATETQHLPLQACSVMWCGWELLMELI